MMTTVEYTMEATSHAGVLAKDHVVLAAKQHMMGKLLHMSSTEEGGQCGGGEGMFLTRTSCTSPLTWDCNIIFADKCTLRLSQIDISPEERHGAALDVPQHRWYGRYHSKFICCAYHYYMQ